MDEYSNDVNLTVAVIEVLPDFEFDASKTSVETDEEVEFTITFNRIDTFTCIIFDGGDGSQLHAFGNEFICELYYSRSAFKYVPFVSKR